MAALRAPFASLAAAAKERHRQVVCRRLEIWLTEGGDALSRAGAHATKPRSGESHELLGFRIPRDLRQPRLAAQLAPAATTPTGATPATAAAPASNSARTNTAGNSACATAGNAASAAATGDPASATAASFD